jgi:anti-sigma regulatory factor (Ser/Thr protein kinase)
VRAAGEPPRPAVTVAASLPLADEAVPARTARRYVERAAAPFGVDLVDAAGLVTTELVTNAVLHTPGVVELQVGFVADGLLVAVEDRSVARPRMRRHSAQAGTGRGMQLAVSYAESWGVELLAAGKRVWVLMTRASVAAALASVPDHLEWADL